MKDPGYRPIRDYAVIGDGQSAALVSGDGSIDWCCWPRFDGPAVFCALLDGARGGRFRVGPAGGHAVSRSYAGPTNVLVTTFTADGGRARLTDFMPVDQGPDRRILRLVEGLGGEVEIEIAFFPTFDYARAPSDLAVFPGGAAARAGRESLRLSCPVPLKADASGAVRGRVRTAPGARLWIDLAYRAGEPPEPPVGAGPEPDALLARTLAYWENWAGGCRYDGPYRDLVVRSALVLKLLTHAPTGALVAAPTTSLPEAIGGVRNWDYRYAWLRDSALVLGALQELGYHTEALAFFDWLESLCLRDCGGVRIMVAVDGKPVPPERTLDHMDGYRGSRPVRIGNAAAEQKQLDVYGEILGAAHVCYETLHPLGEELWIVLRGLADQAALRWREPDQGIWEVRGGPRHFLHSKLLCWVALDRAIRLARKPGLRADVRRWANVRNEIRDAILSEGYNAAAGAFTQAFGESALDASALAIPLVGFLPASDPRVRATVAAIQEGLSAHGLVYRYLAEDGLPGGEAAFAMCSFWLVDNLALDMQLDAARDLFERVAGYANDLGLLAEEIDPGTGDLLGNYPQALTHLALIRAAHCIAGAERAARTGPELACPERGAGDLEGRGPR